MNLKECVCVCVFFSFHTHTHTHTPVICAWRNILTIKQGISVCACVRMSFAESFAATHSFGSVLLGTQGRAVSFGAIWTCDQFNINELLTLCAAVGAGLQDSDSCMSYTYTSAAGLYRHVTAQLFTSLESEHKQIQEQRHSAIAISLPY